MICMRQIVLDVRALKLGQTFCLKKAPRREDLGEIKLNIDPLDLFNLIAQLAQAKDNVRASGNSFSCKFVHIYTRGANTIFDYLAN